MTTHISLKKINGGSISFDVDDSTTMYQLKNIINDAKIPIQFQQITVSSNEKPKRKTIFKSFHKMIMQYLSGSELEYRCGICDEIQSIEYAKYFLDDDTIECDILCEQCSKEYKSCDGNELYYLIDWQSDKLGCGKCSLCNSPHTNYFEGMQEYINKKKCREEAINKYGDVFLTYDGNENDYFPTQGICGRCGKNNDKGGTVLWNDLCHACDNIRPQGICGRCGENNDKGGTVLWNDLCHACDNIRH